MTETVATFHGLKHSLNTASSTIRLQTEKVEVKPLEILGINFLKRRAF